MYCGNHAAKQSSILHVLHYLTRHNASPVNCSNRLLSRHGIQHRKTALGLGILANLVCFRIIAKITGTALHGYPCRTNLLTH